MTSPASRVGRQAVPAPTTAHSIHAPHAALLIDFDNVTLGIRSDLTKELKTLLNSDIIRGKVAVQRAYADWRRYPQYIVPLSERSIDLIFATAVGSTKKNATDIRLAIDAIELVFTRPEIGTFILLSGDSDFSSLVIKLKEYGKYVIGVGIRESASDLLIQNCDEYFSYTELAGLNKEVETPSAQRDPWELVREAVGQMGRQGDVMRSDRLKQVMQQIDPNFDERNAGFSRFSKFVNEAANRGLVKLAKLDNGQFEVGPAEAAAPPPAPEPRVESEDGGRGGRGRGRRGRERDRDRERERGPRPSGRRGEEAKPAERAPAPERLTLGAAFELMTRALEELGQPVDHERLRARMAALHGREDLLLEPERFGRFLRQAFDAEMADVRKIGDKEYEVALPRGRARVRAAAAPPPPAEPVPEPVLPAATAAAVETAMTAVEAEPVAASRTSTLRFRRGSRGGVLKPQEIPLIGVVDIEPETSADEEPAGEKPAGGRSRRGGAKRKAARGKARPAASKAAAGPSPEPALVEAGAAPATEGEPGARRPGRSRSRRGRAKGEAT